MKIRVLGASGSEVPGHNCPAYLVDDTLLLDAGTVAKSLNIREEKSVRHLLLTHAHFDHIKGLPTFVDNLALRNAPQPVTVWSTKEVVADLAKHIFNGRIWPDFTKIPAPDRPALAFSPMKEGVATVAGGYEVVARKVNHTVPACGFVVTGPTGKTVVYPGDSGPTEALWKELAGRRVQAMLIEASLPNRLEEFALRTGHMTPSLLDLEMLKLPVVPDRIFVTHIKTQFLSEVRREIQALGRPNVEFLLEGEVVEL